MISAINTAVITFLLLSGSFFSSPERYSGILENIRMPFRGTEINEESLSAISLKALFRKKPDFAEISKNTKEALVNIVCLPHSSLFYGISGSGVIIDPRGVILTNAHIGQYFLLQNYPTENSISCEIKIGNPAKSSYTAKLFYIPKEWVSENAKMVRDHNPLGTGKNDFALLLITGSIDATPLPSSFPFLKIHLEENNEKGKEVLAAGYPASIISGISLPRDLYSVSSVVKIDKIQSFNGKDKDFLLLSPSSVAERGSSGGAVVNRENKLVSLIVSVKTTGVGFQSQLGTITLSHIDRSITKETGLSLSSYLRKEPDALLKEFSKNTLSQLTREYEKALSPSCTHLAVVPCSFY